MGESAVPPRKRSRTDGVDKLAQDPTEETHCRRESRAGSDTFVSLCDRISAVPYVTGSPFSSLTLCVALKASRAHFVSETEILLKELEQMLRQALEPTAVPEGAEEEQVGTEAAGKSCKCGPEAPVASSPEDHCEEDYLVIDGLKLKAGECIEMEVAVKGNLVWSSARSSVGVLIRSNEEHDGKGIAEDRAT
ncbi:hypothetical protein CB1_000955009 [Camelus ferus]|nr:hypothetical protein CB1_000955009 [Camelus ferus]